MADRIEVGPHDLVIQQGDCEFHGFCSCGSPLGGPIRPDMSLDELGRRWERHFMTKHRECDCEPCTW